MGYTFQVVPFTPSVDYNNWWKSLKTDRLHINIAQPNQGLIKVKNAKSLEQRIREHVYKTLWTSLEYNPMSPPFLDFSKKRLSRKKNNFAMN